MLLRKSRVGRERDSREEKTLFALCVCGKRPVQTETLQVRESPRGTYLYATSFPMWFVLFYMYVFLLFSRTSPLDIQQKRECGVSIVDVYITKWAGCVLDGVGEPKDNFEGYNAIGKIVMNS